MKAMTGLILGLALFIPNHSQGVAQTKSDLSAIASRLSAPLYLRGKFVQEKRLTGFKHSLKSNGEFLQWRKHGLIWTTQKPFESTLVLTRERMHATHGQYNQEIDSKNEPYLTMVNAMMLSLMEGDLDSLRKHFRIRLDTFAGGEWRLHLTPDSNEVIAKMFQRIEIRGINHVRAIDITSPNGDQTLIELSGHLVPKEIAPIERQQLAQ